MEDKAVQEIELRGCRFEPLMNYLKALGTLRAISLQKDPSARGFWQGSHFVLVSNMDVEELNHFFLNEYEPSPVFSPWNRGSGFYPRNRETEAVKIIKKLRNHPSPQLKSTGCMIRIIEDAIEKIMGKKPEEVEDKSIDEHKAELMAYCRNTLPDKLVEWFDVVYALSQDEKFRYEPYYAIVMGSGGNDGNLEFSINYWKSICDIIEMKENRAGKARNALRKSLFEVGDEPAARKVAIGFFHPGGVGGPNATEGFEGESLANPWDFVFMIEGVLLLAGSVTRRLSRESLRSVASFPFSVASVNAGANVVSTREGSGASSRGEMWLPLWKNPMTLNELKHLFSEGRARLGRRTAADGLDFARAVATLGVSRGLTGFVRYGLFQRSGKSYLAVPLGVLPVREEKLKGADLLSDIDIWLTRIRNLTMDENKPARVRKVPRQVYDSIFGYLVKGDKTSFQRLIISLGEAERALSSIPTNKDGRTIPPLNLNHAWAEFADDQTPEFRIAYALAGIGWTEADPRPLRRDLQQVKILPKRGGGHYASWGDETMMTVSYLNDPISFLASILEHRCLLGKKERRELVPIRSVSVVSLEDVQRFLSGSLDYRKIIGLLLGLILVNDPKPLKNYEDSRQKTMSKTYELSRDYVLLKTCFLPEPLFLEGEKITVPYDLKTGSLLKARRLDDACTHAARKLKARGIIPVATFGKEGLDPLCLYASLLLPVDVREFVKRALPLIK